MAVPLPHATSSRALESLTPVEVASRLQHLPGLVFFDTAGHVPSNYNNPASIIAARPREVLTGHIHQPADRARLRAVLDQHANPLQPDAGFPLGGLCGWIDYEGNFTFGDYPEMLVHDHVGDWHEVGQLSSHLTDPPARHNIQLSPPRALTSKKSFLSMVARALDWIAAGDIYQVNLARHFVAGVQGGSLFPLYEALRTASPAPMAAWLSLGGREILSSSPETFLRISARGIETRPIKGTRPRFADSTEDRRSAYELQTSAKEIAELVMITDLLRNDLGQVCEFGSVRVQDMLQLETLEQVHHLVSTVTGTLNSNTDALDAVAACFPGGSITGAPKHRAREIIESLEPTPRGLYCGAIGYFGYHGESQFNIAIRSMERRGDQLHYHAGAGIVADSDPLAEYHETEHKAEGIRLALKRITSGSAHAS